MRKYKLNEQGVEGDEPAKATTQTDPKTFLSSLKDTYKCPFLQGANDLPMKDNFALQRIADKDSANGNFIKGDKIIIFSNFTYDVCVQPYEVEVDENGKKVKKKKCKDVIKGKPWKCTAYQKETVSAAADTQSLTKSQLQYIEDLKKQKGYVSLTPQQQSEVDMGRYKPVDLYYENAKLFPETGKYFLYTRSGEIQTARSTPQQDEVINDLATKGFLKEEPAISESDKYVKVNLRTMEGGKYSQYFRKDFFMWQPISSIDPQKILATRKQTLDAYSVNRKECRQTIDTLHTFWAKGVPFNSDSDRLQLKNHAKRCLKQKEFGRGVDKKVAKLASLPKTDPFSLAESKQGELKSMIHENLIHLSQNKKKVILEQNIVKNRIGFVFESYDKHQNIDKLIGDLSYEYNYLNDQGFNDSLLFEQDGSLLGWSLGRLGGGGVDTIMERFIQGLLAGMGVDPNGWFASIVSIAFGNLEVTDLPKLFRFECGYISGLISKTMVEVLIKKLVKFGDKGDVISDMLRNTLDSMFRNSFEAPFQEMLQSKLCPVLARFTTNAEKVNNELETKVMS